MYQHCFSCLLRDCATCYKYDTDILSGNRFLFPHRTNSELVINSEPLTIGTTHLLLINTRAVALIVTEASVLPALQRDNLWLTSAPQHTVNTWILLIISSCHTERLRCLCVGHNVARLSFRARCYCWLVYYSESRTGKWNIALVITWRLSRLDTFGH